MGAVGLKIFRWVHGSKEKREGKHLKAIHSYRSLERADLDFKFQ